MITSLTLLLFPLCCLCHSDAANVREFVNKMYFMSCAVFFGVLVVLAAYYIHRLRTARRSTAGTSSQEVLVTSMIFVIFLSRCIWDLLAAFDATSSTFRQGLWETPTRHIKLMATETFCLLFVWEIIPTLMVIVYFRNIPNSQTIHTHTHTHTHAANTNDTQSSVQIRPRKHPNIVAHVLFFCCFLFV